MIYIIFVASFILGYIYALYDEEVKKEIVDKGTKFCKEHEDG
jgi:hypothetical protein